MPVNRSNFLLYHFLITILSPSQFLCEKMLLQKKLGEMLIEQIIKFELRGPRPPSRTCTPITGLSHDNKNF